MASGQASRNLYLRTAVEAVRKAGEIQLQHFGTGFLVRSKEGSDIVTEVDFEVERMFREMIAERFPQHGVLAEELGERAPADGAGHRWLFDPIDGTVNYAHGLPIFCASLALEVHGTVEVAAVYDPSRRELFTAERNGGAWLNEEPMRVSQISSMDRAALGAGFPHGASSRVATMETMFCELAVRASAIRRLGSAALDLCNVACGRLDGFWDANLKPWDTAAGALIVQEAGGAVTALDGTTFDAYAGNVLASNGCLHEQLLQAWLAAGHQKPTE